MKDGWLAIIHKFLLSATEIFIFRYGTFLKDQFRPYTKCFRKINISNRRLHMGTNIYVKQDTLKSYAKIKIVSDLKTHSWPRSTKPKPADVPNLCTNRKTTDPLILRRIETWKRLAHVVVVKAGYVTPGIMVVMITRISSNL